jgi:hypothetical protein
MDMMAKFDVETTILLGFLFWIFSSVRHETHSLRISYSLKRVTCIGRASQIFDTKHNFHDLCDPSNRVSFLFISLR